jgi:hypothetical protein
MNIVCRRLAIIIFIFWKMKRRLMSLFQRSSALFYRFFGHDYLCGCGHVSKRKTYLAIGDLRGVHILSKDKDYCPKCWADAVIPCAWCARPILPGDSVTLFSPGEEEFVLSCATIYSENPLRLVGCIRCSEMGVADRQGVWGMPGEVHRVPNIYEMLLANPGSAVVVEDISDVDSMKLV